MLVAGAIHKLGSRLDKRKGVIDLRKMPDVLRYTWFDENVTEAFGNKVGYRLDLARKTEFVAFSITIYQLRRFFNATDAKSQTSNLMPHKALGDKTQGVFGDVTAILRAEKPA